MSTRKYPCVSENTYQKVLVYTRNYPSVPESLKQGLETQSKYPSQQQQNIILLTSQFQAPTPILGYMGVLGSKRYFQKLLQAAPLCQPHQTDRFIMLDPKDKFSFKKTYFLGFVTKFRLESLLKLHVQSQDRRLTFMYIFS